MACASPDRFRAALTSLCLYPPLYGAGDFAVRDYLLDYFVDKIFVYDDRVILTAWYGDDKKEITWGDIDCVVVKDRKRKKGSSSSELVPHSGGLPLSGA